MGREQESLRWAVPNTIENLAHCSHTDAHFARRFGMRGRPGSSQLPACRPYGNNNDESILDTDVAGEKPAESEIDV